MTRKHKSKNTQRNNVTSEPVTNVTTDFLEPLLDILVDMIISNVDEVPINASDLESMLQNTVVKEDGPINASDLETILNSKAKKETHLNASDLEALLLNQNSKVKENSDSNAKVIINIEDDFTVFPYPMTNDFIRKIMKKDYPKMPEYKLNRLMKEYERMDKSDWVEGELLFPSSKNLPKDFWNFDKS